MVSGHGCTMLFPARPIACYPGGPPGCSLSSEVAGNKVLCFAACALVSLASACCEVVCFDSHATGVLVSRLFCCRIRVFGPVFGARGGVACTFLGNPNSIRVAWEGVAGDDPISNKYCFVIAADRYQ